jgi:hypothetical protein
MIAITTSNSIKVKPRLGVRTPEGSIIGQNSHR